MELLVGSVQVKVKVDKARNGTTWFHPLLLLALVWYCSSGVLVYPAISHPSAILGTLSFLVSTVRDFFGGSI